MEPTLYMDSQLTWTLAYYRQKVCLTLSSSYNSKLFTDYCRTAGNLVPRGSKMRDPGNKVGLQD